MDDPSIFDYIGWFIDGMFSGLLSVFRPWHLIGIIVGAYIFHSTFNRRK